MTSADSETRLDLREGDEVALLLNNLGGTTDLEMGVLARDLLAQAEVRGWRVRRFYRGALETSLEMAGVMVTALKCKEAKMLELLDHPVNAPAWPRSSQFEGAEIRQRIVDFDDSAEKAGEKSTKIIKEWSPLDAKFAEACVSSVLEAVTSAEAELNDLDSGSGDGDCGSTLRRGAERAAQANIHKAGSVSGAFDILSAVAEESMGGAAGGMYSVLFASVAAGTENGQDVSEALLQGTQAMMKYGRADLGDRTMLDALVPAIKVFESCRGLSLAERLRAASEAAEVGSRSTSAMRARAGRASYVRGDLTVGREDPGARAVAVVAAAISEAAAAAAEKM